MSVYRFVRQRGWLAAAAAAAVVVGGTAGAPGALAQGSAASTHFKGTIKIGIISDITGPSSIGSGVQGILAYFDSVNASGGIDGYKIVPTEYDSQSSPSVDVQVVRKAIAAKPALIIGGSFYMATSIPTLAASGIPAVGDGASPGWIGHKTLFSILGDNQLHQSDAPLVIAKDYAHATKIAIFGSSYAALSQAAIVKEAPEAGVKIVLQDVDVPLVPTSADFLQAAEQIKASGAQAVIGLGSAGLAELQVDLNQLHANVHVVANDEWTKPVAAEDGLLFSQQWANPYVTGDPGVAQYRAAMAKFGYSSLLNNVWTTLRWAQAVLAVQALEAAGAPFSHAATVKVLSTTKNFTAGGMIAPASFPYYQSGGGHCQAVMEVIGTKWKSLVNGASPFVCGAKAVLLKAS